MTKSRIFWLKSDGRTIEEIQKHGWELGNTFWEHHHVVIIHTNGELYTNRNSILGKQMRRLAEEILKK